MDPVTAAAALQLVSLALKTWERHSAGEISQEEALAIFRAAGERAVAAIDAFEQAAAATKG